MKEYSIPGIYRGQQITKIVCAKNLNDASKLLEVSIYELNKYGYKEKINNPFNGISSYFDSGFLWVKEKKLIGVKMPFYKLKQIIDKHRQT
tara:strand:- start:1118 stop:1390 length:273 start_codon:yes stop_codon:yes gene_type:complete